MSLRLLFTLALVGTKGALFAPGVSLERPRFTQCRSPELESFTCRWTCGDFQNFSGDVRVLFAPRRDSTWSACPDYQSAGDNSCYFNSSFASSAETGYCLQLVHGNESLDEYCFDVEDIFQPDPPVGLNWTLVHLSVTEVRVQVRWGPPPSAARIDLTYELQYRGANESEWRRLDAANATAVPLDTLQPDRDYEIRVRCRGTAAGNFGEFSDIHYVSFSPFPPVNFQFEPEFPWPLFIIFGTLGGAGVLLLIRLSKQRRFRPCGLSTCCNQRKSMQRDAGANA